MQSRCPKITIKMGGKRPDLTQPVVNSNQGFIEKDQTALEEGPSVPSSSDSKKTDQNVVDGSSSEHSTDDEDKDKDTPLFDDSLKQMVLYKPPQNGSEVVKVIQNPKPLKARSFSRAAPEVGAFTVQCAKCFKWRLIPDQEKYEVIREHITDQPFLCETTRQWDRDVSCDDPTDIEQDGSRIWAIDKPDIAQPPPGWKRLLRLRSEGSSKFADVYYTSPTGSKLRSLPDVQRYLEHHPQHAQGIGLARFSFQVPRPLRENYVKKRPTQTPAPKTPEYLEPSPVEPIAWAGPEENVELQIAEPLSWAGPVENRNGAAKKARRYDMDCL